MQAIIDLEEHVTTTANQLGRPIGANSEETRKRIMFAAMRLVAEVGYTRATIREVAREAEMTSGTLYHYFPNKSELVRTTFNEFAGTAVTRMAEAALTGNTLLDNLVAVLDEADQVMREFPHIAAFEQAVRVEGAQHLNLQVASNSIFTTMRGLLEQIVTSGGPHALTTDVDGTVNVLYALLRGLVETAATASPDDYHSTLRSAKLLIRGQLFNYTELT
ncbi:TetR/AcrR family transcriptional regulator [Williamsia sp. DF01-3]|uniref:TetR/AcrR family transcriptional regulator n=1 Tax=Williamsia sp. DF01-3 TaxID=2934157 RepID=UPI001FF4DB8A|nr:TetR/AcrR family transcriptional regulator [Williamsia sp. DF01-3]MCK0516700.1 TetR/AcrR family transcriptional regulator [Williamsia sp. DF01-3]